MPVSHALPVSTALRGQQTLSPAPLGRTNLTKANPTLQAASPAQQAWPAPPLR